MRYYRNTKLTNSVIAVKEPLKELGNWKEISKEEYDGQFDQNYRLAMI